MAGMSGSGGTGYGSPMGTGVNAGMNMGLASTANVHLNAGMGANASLAGGAGAGSYPGVQYGNTMTGMVNAPLHGHHHGHYGHVHSHGCAPVTSGYVHKPMPYTGAAELVLFILLVIILRACYI